ncbi:MAG TPA: hypothetical protein VFN77_09525 [Acetobacteraceae bacterium]|nr:hypothetical protein [Acetobacteraceae bacterium]
MRRMIISLLAATLYSGAAMANACVPSTTQQAFEVVGLKSTLMVSALACGERDQYNQFMDRFQPHVFSELQRLTSYFKELHGRLGQRHEDDYMTSLANAQSSVGIHEGSNYCAASESLFGKVLALQTVSDLDNFVRQAPPTQPIVTVQCGIVQSDSFRRMARLAPSP